MDRINAFKNNLEKLDPFSNDLTDYFKRNKASSLFKRLPIKEELNLAQQRMNDGYYLFRPCGIELDESECNRCALELLEIIKTHLEDRGSDISDISSALIKEKIIAHDLILSIIKNEGNEIRKVIRKNNLAEDLVTFYAIYLARPFREQVAAHLLDGIEDLKWTFGYCPNCGHWPSLGHIHSESGQRTLWCLHCNLKWDFKRVQCAFCMTEVQTNLEILSIEEDDSYRIQICKKCKRYLKEIRSLESAANFPFDKIYMATLPLDLVARQEGYIQESMLTVRYDNSDGNESLMYRQEKFFKEMKSECK